MLSCVARNSVLKRVRPLKVETTLIIAQSDQISDDSILGFPSRRHWKTIYTKRTSPLFIIHLFINM